MSTATWCVTCHIMSARYDPFSSVHIRHPFRKTSAEGEWHRRLLPWILLFTFLGVLVAHVPCKEKRREMWRQNRRKQTQCDEVFCRSHRTDVRCGCDVFAQVFFFNTSLAIGDDTAWWKSKFARFQHKCKDAKSRKQRMTCRPVALSQVQQVRGCVRGSIFMCLFAACRHGPRQERPTCATLVFMIGAVKCFPFVVIVHLFLREENVQFVNCAQAQKFFHLVTHTTK